MADNKQTIEVEEIAGGMDHREERHRRPGVSQAAYFVIFLGAAVYLIIYMYGEVSHADRGPLVQQFNKSTDTSEGLMYFIAALCVVFFLAMVKFVFSKPHKD